VAKIAIISTNVQQSWEEKYREEKYFSPQRKQISWVRPVKQAFVGRFVRFVSSVHIALLFIGQSAFHSAVSDVTAIFVGRSFKFRAFTSNTSIIVAYIRVRKQQLH
jgi:hypothetical protein